ncbi:hypothetical protein K2P96_00410 [Patescibacteria group bacterium]|nr:hypothetical protein [Patescibacteria group bacterium]
MDSIKLKVVFGILRLLMGFMFLWAFLDKLFGLGLTTTPDKAWLAGGSPTSGFLAFGVHGPFTAFFHSLSGNPLVDWLFMLGLLFIGVTLTFGISVKLGSWAGIIMLLLMYSAVGIWPANNPFIDEHLIYIFVMASFLFTNPGKYFGFGNVWYRSSFVQKYKIFA